MSFYVTFFQFLIHVHVLTSFSKLLYDTWINKVIVIIIIIINNSSNSSSSSSSSSSNTSSQ